MYKSREGIEAGFDALKNDLENDKTYLRDDDGVRGYFFVSFLSLYLHYRILGMLKKKKLSRKVSVKEALLELSKVCEIRSGDAVRLAAVPARAERLAALLDVDINPKP